MNEKIEQASAGVASELNAELDNRLLVLKFMHVLGKVFTNVWIVIHVCIIVDKTL